MIVVVPAILSALATFTHAQGFPPGNIVNGTYTGAPNDTCVMPLDNNGSTDTPVVLGYCAEATSAWNFTNAGNIIFSRGNQCITVENRENLVISPCTGAPDQTFAYLGSTIAWGNSSTMCVTSSDLGKQLVITPCGGPNQSLTLPIPPYKASFATRTVPETFCIDAPLDAPGTPLQFSPCNGNASQIFNIANETYLIYTDKAITPVNGDTTPGTPLEINILGSSPNQLWGYNYTTGLFTLRNDSVPARYIGASQGKLIITDSNFTTFTAEGPPPPPPA